MRRIEPEEALSQPIASPEEHEESQMNFLISVDSRAEFQSSLDLPGTSSVSLSLRTPKLHLSGLDLISAYSSVEDPLLAPGRSGEAFEEPKIRLHFEAFISFGPPVEGAVSASSGWPKGGLLVFSFVAMEEERFSVVEKT